MLVRIIYIGLIEVEKSTIPEKKKINKRKVTYFKQALNTVLCMLSVEEKTTTTTTKTKNYQHVLNSIVSYFIFLLFLQGPLPPPKASAITIFRRQESILVQQDPVAGIGSNFESLTSSRLF